MKQYPPGSLGYIWQRFGALIVLGSLLIAFIGIMIYASSTENIERGDTPPMSVRR